MLESNTNMFEKLNAKKEDERPPNHLLGKREAHSLMKQSISCSGVPYISMAIEIKWCPS